MAPRWLGTLLHSRRADVSLSAWTLLESDIDLPLKSPAFADGEPIPRRFAGPGVGDNVSPPLQWSGVPVEADHLVFILEDIDVPFSRPLIHTLSLLPPDATALPEGALARGSSAAVHLRGMLGSGYSGPRPIVGHGPHRYRFMLFAVQGNVDTSSQRAAIDSMVGHVVARGRVVGTYER
jgi:phosphatidylethanolamine-binding protein (PEBP) family uncharacterized protein